MPSNIPSYDSRFLDGFLHTVLAEVARTCKHSLLRYRCIECFGDGDQGDFFGASAASFGCSRDSFLHSREPLSYVFGHRAESYQRP